MSCPQCGSPLPPRDGVCPACGPVGPASDETMLPGRDASPPASDETMLPGGWEASRTPDDAAPRPRATRATLSVGQPFGSRYLILKVLGEGGMGAVYQAWDESLGVAVALKVIRPDVLISRADREDLERRFKRELLLARKVTHRHVVRIHDLGEVDGITYITMSFVEGEDLATTVKRDGTLPVARVVRLARQVASGLAAAHEAGVVHRDLKPANIMIDGEDNALIMDFGIALSSGRDSAGRRRPPAPVPSPPGAAATPEPAALPADESLTIMPTTPPPAVLRETRSGTVLSDDAGAVVGTLEYMAPEQARGASVDHRADIYAFGLILADLVSGIRKVPPGTTPWQALTDRVSKPPSPLRERHPAAPEALDAVVTKCLQIDPADRYQTTAELVAALDRLDEAGNLIPEPKIRRLTARAVSAAVVVVAGLLAATYWTARGPAQPPPPPEPVSVLIADFTNGTQEPVFDGLLEQALAVGVENASFVSVFPRRDALRLAAQVKMGGRLDGPTAALLALREGVDRVVAGAITKDGNAYRLDVRLLNPAEPEGKQQLLQWDTQAADKDAVLGAVGRMAARLREGLGDTAANSNAGRDGESFTAASLDAAHAYTAAQELQWAGKYIEAFAEYQQAVRLDPDMGRAYAGLGAVASSLGRRDEAEEYYKQALAHLGRMTEREKYRTRGGYYLLTRNTEKAREEMSALVRQYPADSAGLINLALAEFYRRDMARAVELGRQASALLPRNVLRKNNTALFAMYAGDFDLALSEAAGVLEINPEFAKAHVAIGLSLLATGKPAEAEAAFQKLAALQGSGPWFAAAGLADVAMYQGRLSAAAALLAPAIKAELDASRRARLVVTLAEVRLAQDRPREATALARQALAASGDESITYLAGRVLAGAGQHAAALDLVKKLLERLDAESLALARVLEGEVALAAGDPRKAIERFRTARQFADSWLGRLGLGRAYLALGATAEADSEFDLCVKRRGEAAAALLDDVPTYRLAAPLAYYQGRVREALGSPDARDRYETFVRTKQPGDESGLVSDARKRLAALQ